MNVYDDIAAIEQRKKDTIKFLETYRGGGLLLEIGENLAEVTEACQRAQKPGIVTIKIGMKPLGSDGAMEIGDDVSTKKPKLSKGTNIFFATPNGALHKSDPRQVDMELKTLEKVDRDGTIKSVDAGNVVGLKSV